MSRSIFILIIMLAFCLNAFATPRVRPASWAVPVIDSEMENFYKVSDKVYRSEQPNKQAFRELKSLGITSVLNLRNYHTDNDEAKNIGVVLYSVPMDAGSITPEHIFQSLSIIKKSPLPIVVHCWHGSDRTGTIIAAYRMVLQGWSKKQAIDEFRKGGFGYHERFYPELVSLLRELEVIKLRTRLGLKP